MVRNIIGRRRNSQDFLSPPQDFYRKPLVRVAPHDLGNFDLVRSLVFDAHHIFVTPLLQFESLLRILGHRFFRDSASVRFIGQHARIVLHIAHYHIGNTAQGVVRGDRYRRRFSVDTRASLVHLQINVLGASQTGALEFQGSLVRSPKTVFVVDYHRFREGMNLSISGTDQVVRGKAVPHLQDERSRFVGSAVRTVNHKTVFANFCRRTGTYDKAVLRYRSGSLLGFFFQLFLEFLVGLLHFGLQFSYGLGLVCKNLHKALCKAGFTRRRKPYHHQRIPTKRSLASTNHHRLVRTNGFNFKLTRLQACKESPFATDITFGTAN